MPGTQHYCRTALLLRSTVAAQHCCCIALLLRSTIAQSGKQAEPPSGDATVTTGWGDCRIACG
ncbi:hypothetical protein, partial [Nocardia sp. NPDC057353]|uniref:hypothetical protein n=1 Tax=Nocardia sp. NPDC057353 TaxID=3346104 RepID=UPI00362FAB52